MSEEKDIKQEYLESESIVQQKEKFWAKDNKELLAHFGTSINGYSQKHAEDLLSVNGPNELAEEEKETIWEKIMEQFEDNLVRILLVAACISFIIALTEKSEGISSYIEPLVILIILIANGAIGIVQDINADKALDALKKMQKCNCLVKRDGDLIQIDSKFLIPGDIVHLNEGEKVPADIRLLEINSATFEVDQSSLTGETDPKPKDTSPIKLEKPVIATMSNTVFSSTGVTAGEAIGIVVYTGMNTQIGNVQKLIKEGQDEEEKSPLKIKLEAFGDTLSYLILFICIIVWAINFNNFFDEIHGGWFSGCIYYFKISVALAVAAIPEGLPAVITTCLALGSRRLSKQNAIVRKLPSIETLGCTSVICSDKTGTLTTNNMTISRFLMFGNQGINEPRVFEVEGTSFNPKGKVVEFNDAFNEILDLQNRCSAINNSSILTKDENNKYSIIGTPTEGALRVLVEKTAYLNSNYKKTSGSVQDYNDTLNSQYKVLYTLNFDRIRKCKSILAMDLKTNKPILFVKGAVEFMVKKSTSVYTTQGIKEFKDENREQVLSNISENFMKKGLRTLAVCVKTELPELKEINIHDHKTLNEYFKNKENITNLEKNLSIISVVGMLDPPRPEVAESIKMCHEAGIRVFMITGDEIETAKSIGVSIGIIDKELASESSFYAAEFMKKKESEQLEILKTKPKLIFARSEPEHKQTLIKLLQKLNYVVAMTGDGTNDAAALSKSNIGIAMGIAGVEVAKEASHMVLADDNFATIVKAVEEGRSIYMNMKAFIRYMISSNIGEVVSIFISSVFGLPEAFTSIQLLWVNLVTDGPPATALSFNPCEKEIMKKAPRGHEDPLLTPFVIGRYMIIGIYVGCATIGIFAYWYTSFAHVDGHTLVSWHQVTNWTKCDKWEGFAVNDYGNMSLSQNPCSYFTVGKKKPVTLALTVLVMIEMLNALNAISDESSILSMTPFTNPYLIVAIFGSISVHCIILYIPFFNDIFGIMPLDLKEWALVLAFSVPVILLDEIIKLFVRNFISVNKQHAIEHAKIKSE